jgi:hypothetical protein
MAKAIVISCRLCPGCWQVIPDGRCAHCRRADSNKYQALNLARSRSYKGQKKLSRKPKHEITAEDVRAALRYDPLTGDFFRWGKSSALGTLNAGGYLIISLLGWTFRAHRLAWLYVHGVWPSELIDHINGSRIDNRIVNLREVSHTGNCQNLRAPKSHNRSGFLGVLWCPKSKKWLARITVAGRAHVLGRYSNPEDASVAYWDAKKRLHPGANL